MKYLLIAVIFCSCSEVAINGPEIETETKIGCYHEQPVTVLEEYDFASLVENDMTGDTLYISNSDIEDPKYCWMEVK